MCALRKNWMGHLGTRWMSYSLTQSIPQPPTLQACAACGSCRCVPALPVAVSKAKVLHNQGSTATHKGHRVEPCASSSEQRTCAKGHTFTNTVTEHCGMPPSPGCHQVELQYNEGYKGSN